MNEMELRSYNYDRDQALREEIMDCRDKFFMQGAMRGTVAEERENFLSKLFSIRF